MALDKAKEIVSSNSVVVFRAKPTPRSPFPPLFSSLHSGGDGVFCRGDGVLHRGDGILHHGDDDDIFHHGDDIFRHGKLRRKTFCPFCTRAKQLLTQLGAKFKVIELDEENDGSEIQAALAQWTAQRTVPNVFIGGSHIGGSDTLAELHEAGKLVPLLTEAGALASSAA